MPQYQSLVAWVAIPGGPQQSHNFKAIARKPACGVRYAFQWLAERGVNRTGDFKSSGNETGQGLRRSDYTGV